LIRKVTNLFKNTKIKVAFRANNTVYQQLVQKRNSMNPSGLYEIKCNTCSKSYVGHSGRPIVTRHKEHIRYIKTNNPVSTYATHILNNRHECGIANDTLKLIQPCKKYENEPLGKYVHKNIPPTGPAYHGTTNQCPVTFSDFYKYLNLVITRLI